LLLTLVVVRYHKISAEALQACKFCDYTTLAGRNAQKKSMPATGFQDFHSLACRISWLASSMTWMNAFDL
jgi:hypothetical protein